MDRGGWIEIRRAPRRKVVFNGPQGDGVAGGKELVNRECRGRAARLNQGTVHDVLADFLQGGRWRWEGERNSGRVGVGPSRGATVARGAECASPWAGGATGTG